MEADMERRGNQLVTSSVIRLTFSVFICICNCTNAFYAQGQGMQQGEQCSLFTEQGKE